MTRNQIDAAKLKEEQRHNLEMERQGYSTIGESIRHNQAQEGVNWYTASSLAALQGKQGAKLDVETSQLPQELAVRQKDADTRQDVAVTGMRQAAELERHNKAAERGQIYSATADAVSGIAQGILRGLGG